nr:uncharacterized protein LOC111421203 [Onthophagus taurus]
MAQFNASSLKDLALHKINISIEKRVDVLKLHRKLPWTLVLDLWKTWFQTNWNELGAHVHCHENMSTECIEFEIFKYKMNHKVQCALFREPHLYRDDLFFQIHGNDESGKVCVWITYYETEHGRVCGECFTDYEWHIVWECDFYRNKDGFKDTEKRIRLEHKTINKYGFIDLVENKAMWCAFCLKRSHFKFILREYCSDEVHEILEGV